MMIKGLLFVLSLLVALGCGCAENHPKEETDQSEMQSEMQSDASGGAKTKEHLKELYVERFNRGDAVGLSTLFYDHDNLPPKLFSIQKAMAFPLGNSFSVKTAGFTAYEPNHEPKVIYGRKVTVNLKPEWALVVETVSASPKGEGHIELPVGLKDGRYYFSGLVFEAEKAGERNGDESGRMGI